MRDMRTKADALAFLNWKVERWRVLGEWSALEVRQRIYVLRNVARLRREIRELASAVAVRA